MKFSHLCILFLTVFSCKTADKSLTRIVGKNIAIDSTIVSSSIIDSMVVPYKNKLIVEMNEVLSYTNNPIVKDDGKMQSSLGNLMADLFYEIANPIFKKKTNTSIDFAMFNNGGLRANISAGKIIKEDAFKLMPFENEFVVVELTGEKISELVAYFIKNKVAHPLSKHITLSIEETSYDLKINEKRFDKNKSYWVLTSDYLQGGGDKMDFFKTPKKLIKLDYKIRDGIIDYFIKTDTLRGAIDNRIILK